MNRLLWLLCICFSLSAMGCMEEVLRDKPGINRQGGSARARQIENDMDWDTLN